MDFVRFNAPSHPSVNAWARSINNQAQAAKVPPCALAALVARESSGQNILQHGMPPGPGCGVGLTQITSGVNWTNINTPKYGGLPLMDPSSNLYVAAKFFLAPLIKNCEQLRVDHPAAVAAYAPDEILYLVFAAYNAGFGGMSHALLNGTDPNTITTDHYVTGGNIGALDFYHAFLKESHGT